MLAGVWRTCLVLVLAAVHASLGLGFSLSPKPRCQHVLHAFERGQDYGAIEALQIVSALDGKETAISTILAGEKNDVAVLILFRSFG